MQKRANPIPTPNLVPNLNPKLILLANFCARQGG